MSTKSSCAANFENVTTYFWADPNKVSLQVCFNDWLSHERHLLDWMLIDLICPSSANLVPTPQQGGQFQPFFLVTQNHASIHCAILDNHHAVQSFDCVPLLIWCNISFGTHWVSFSQWWYSNQEYLLCGICLKQQWISSVFCMESTLFEQARAEYWSFLEGRCLQCTVAECWHSPSLIGWTQWYSLPMHPA